MATGTPQTLGGRQDAPAEIRFRRPPGMDPAALLGAGAGAEDGWVSFRTSQPGRVLRTLEDWSREQGTELPGLEVRRPSLEDIYLQLVGGEPR